MGETPNQRLYAALAKRQWREASQYASIAGTVSAIGGTPAITVTPGGAVVAMARRR